MNVASMRPLLNASAMVGKSVNRFDSNRVVVLVRDAKSVTGHVRCQVTGRKPTLRSSRACACCTAAPRDPSRHGLNLELRRALDRAVYAVFSISDVEAREISDFVRDRAPQAGLIVPLA